LSLLLSLSTREIIEVVMLYYYCDLFVWSEFLWIFARDEASKVFSTGIYLYYREFRICSTIKLVSSLNLWRCLEFSLVPLISKVRFVFVLIGVVYLLDNFKRLYLEWGLTVSVLVDRAIVEVISSWRGMIDWLCMLVKGDFPLSRYFVC